MQNIKVLDCTLRDGGRLFDCNFSKYVIQRIVNNLNLANLEVIELGFLRNEKVRSYNENSTFFNSVMEAEKIIPKESNSEYTLFVDYGLYDIDKLEPVNDNSKIKSIRFAFTKKDYDEEIDSLKRSIIKLKNKGYNIYFQPINTLAYSKKDLNNLICIANKHHIKSFAIVDTYGILYSEDLSKLLKYVNKRLNKGMTILFHSHNSYQLSFSLAQQFISVIKNRSIIIDGTLGGIGKCAGNLPTELICHYLNAKYKKGYDLNLIYQLNDDIILKYRDKYDWGYSQYTMIQGDYQVHPNNIIYLQSNNVSLITAKRVLSKLDSYSRLRYFYNTLDVLVEEEKNNDCNK